MRQNYDQPIKFQVNYATGEIDGFTQGSNTYWYRKNQQGDVTGIFSINYGNTALFVEYEYDAWGNVISITGDGASTIGQTNPIRYRGYFYDTETGYYYLNSRYYDPTTGRFLNCDVYASTGQGVLGCNAFAYCLNNPITFGDPNGTDAIVLMKTDGLSRRHIGLLIQDENGDWWHYFWGASSTKELYLSIINSTIPATIHLEKYTGDISLKSINYDTDVYFWGYEDGLYFEGDFSSSFEKLPKEGNYTFLKDNCTTVCLNTLAAADTPYQEEFSNASEYLDPGAAYNYLSNHTDAESIPNNLISPYQHNRKGRDMLK